MRFAHFIHAGRAREAWESLAWSFLRHGPAGTLGRLARKMVRGAPARAPLGDAERYREWIGLREPGPAALERMRRAMSSRAGGPPLLSLVVPVAAPAPQLGRCLGSLAAQVHPAWEACVVPADGVGMDDLRLLDAFAAREPRLRLAPTAPGALVAANRGLEMARGEWVALLDPAATLAPRAVAEVARASSVRPDADVVYGDEDSLDPQGRRTEPVFKPGWSPELFLSIDVLGRPCAFRRTLLAETGGLRSGFDGAADYDLALRLTERARAVVHVPGVLYHRAPARRDAGDEAAARRAVEEALARRGLQGRVEQAGPGARRVRYAMRGEPLISVVIPTRDRAELLRVCLDGVLSRSTWRRLELLIVDNGSSHPEALRVLRGVAPPHRVLPDAREFNWAALNNRAAREARGELLVFLNNDVEVISPDWLEALAEQAQRGDVAAAGPKLLYADGRVQHAGLVLGLEGAVGHAFRFLEGDAPGHLGLARATRECSAVTGACLMTRREVFEDLGGFDERFRVAYNDVDYCLRGRERGHRVIYVAHALLRHFESATRRGAVSRDSALLRRRWGALVARGDPYYNPNLSLDGGGFGLRLQP